MFDPASEAAPSEYKSEFDQTVFTKAVVCDAKRTGVVLKALRGLVVSQRRVRSVLEADGGRRKIVLDPLQVTELGISDLDDVRKARPVASEDLVALVDAQFTLSTDNYTMDEILRQLLPNSVVIPSGFEQIGHIAHLNLQSSQLPFKHLIGRVLLDCNAASGVKTVVNKLEIKSQFRELDLELLAGVNDMVAQVREHGCVFHVPFDKVYWNSRLSREHTRLVEHIAPADVLFDVMAGVGPFVLPALKRGVRKVYGNDLNPASVDAMTKNVSVNIASSDRNRFAPSCEDGRAFIRRIRAEHLTTEPQTGSRRHFVMNLPAIAVTFVDAFVDPPLQEEVDTNFVVHVYCFSRSSDNEGAQADAVRQVSEVLKHPLEARYVEGVHVVRDVAPKKLMVCVSFRLPHELWRSARHRAE